MPRDPSMTWRWRCWRPARGARSIRGQVLAEDGGAQRRGAMAPDTYKKIQLLTACLKDGGYKSAQLYIAAAIYTTTLAHPAA